MAITAVELAGPPLFSVGDKVRCRSPIRNDGTYHGRRIGEMLVDTGEPGYVQGVGIFLQRYYIYDVDYFERGMIVGMRGHELDLVENNHESHAAQDA